MKHILIISLFSISHIICALDPSVKETSTTFSNPIKSKKVKKAEKFEEAEEIIQNYADYVDSLIGTFDEPMQSFLADKKNQLTTMFSYYDQHPQRKKMQQLETISDITLLKLWTCAYIDQSDELLKMYKLNLDNLIHEKNQIIQRKRKYEYQLEQDRALLERASKSHDVLWESVKNDAKKSVQERKQAIEILNKQLFAYDKIILHFNQKIKEGVLIKSFKSSCPRDQRFATTIKWLADQIDPIFQYILPAESRLNVTLNKMHIADEQLREWKYDLLLYKIFQDKKYALSGQAGGDYFVVNALPHTLIERIIRIGQYIFCNESIDPGIRTVAQKALQTLLNDYQKPQQIQVALVKGQPPITLSVQLTSSQVQRIKAILQGCVSFKEFAGIRELKKWSSFGIRGGR